MILTCAYSVSPGEYIDSIKWYLNNSECYRIVPGLTQDRVLTFAPGGDCISLPQSGILKPGTHRLVINNASQTCSGKYICQVTESRPPFKTEQAAAVLQVLGNCLILKGLLKFPVAVSAKCYYTSIIHPIISFWYSFSTDCIGALGSVAPFILNWIKTTFVYIIGLTFSQKFYFANLFTHKVVCNYDNGRK